MVSIPWYYIWNKNIYRDLNISIVTENVQKEDGLKHRHMNPAERQC